MLFILFFIILCLAYALWYKRWNTKLTPFPAYPGRLPLIGHAYLFLGDNAHVWKTFRKISMECLKKGGLNISMGPITYQVLTDPEDCAVAMNASLDKHYIFSFAKEWLGEGLLTASTPIWKSNHKLLYPMFNQQVLNGFLSLFNQQSKRFVNQIATHVGKGPFDHSINLHIIGLETICQTALGLDVADQVTDHTEYMNAIEGMMEGFVQRFQQVWLHADCIFNMSSLKKKQDEHLKSIHKMSSTVLQNRKALLLKKSKTDVERSGEFKPFIDQILEIPKSKSNFTDKEIVEEINTLMMTGYDMTALLLTYALMLLGTYHDVQDRAYQELQEIFGESDRDVEKQDLSKLIYIEAVLKESLRLFPVTPLIARYNSTYVKLKNCTLPAGSNCFVSIYGLHRHPIWGPDVEQFKPQRWLDPSSLPDNPNVFAGFGMGRRACIGRVYSMMSMKTTLAHVLRRYKVKSDVTKLVLKIDALLKPASGQHIIIELRK